MPHVSHIVFGVLLAASAPAAAQDPSPAGGRQDSTGAIRPPAEDASALDQFLGWLGQQADKPAQPKKDWNNGFKRDHGGGRGSGGGDGGGSGGHGG